MAVKLTSPGSGRKKGVPNKLSTNLRLQILQAMNEADPAGGIAYLKKQAIEQPVAFLGILGKCLPKEIVGQINSDINVRSLNVHRLDISGLSDDELDALEGAMRKTYMIEHQKVVDATVNQVVEEELVEVESE